MKKSDVKKGMLIVPNGTVKTSLHIDITAPGIVLEVLQWNKWGNEWVCKLISPIGLKRKNCYNCYNSFVAQGKRATFNLKHFKPKDQDGIYPIY